jgi:hypothetical protein
MDIRRWDCHMHALSGRQQRGPIGREARPAREPSDEPSANLAPGTFVGCHDLAAKEVGEVDPPARSIVLHGLHAEADPPPLVDDSVS